MSAAPVDYAALAKQAGATDSQPATVDYAALAKQAGATDSQPASAPAPAPKDPTMMERVNDPDKTYADLSGGTGLYNNATLAGGATVVQGAKQMAQGVLSAAKPPSDSHEQAVAATLGPAGLLAFRMGKGLVGAGQDVGQVKGAIKDINASPDPLGTYGEVVGKTAGQAAGQATVAALSPVASNAAGKAVAAVSSMRDIPAALSTDTVGTFNKVAHSEGLPTSTATTARDAAADLSKNFIQRAKAQYGVVDKAVDGDLKPVQEKISSLEEAVEVNKNVNPDLSAKFFKQLVKQRETLDSLVQKAKANGVPNAEELMKAGDKDYSRGMATSKVQDGIARASGLAKTGGNPHPGGFASQVDNLERTGVLQKALGQDATDEMVQNARTGLARTRSLKSAGTAAKTAAKIVAVPAAAGVGYGAYKALSGQ